MSPKHKRNPQSPVTSGKWQLVKFTISRPQTQPSTEDWCTTQIEWERTETDVRGRYKVTVWRIWQESIKVLFAGKHPFLASWKQQIKIWKLKWNKTSQWGCVSMSYELLHLFSPVEIPVTFVIWSWPVWKQDRSAVSQMSIIWHSGWK